MFIKTQYTPYLLKSNYTLRSQNYKISIVIFCAGALIAAIAVPAIMEAEAKKEKERKANENFDEKCIEYFLELKRVGADIDKIEKKLQKEKCLSR